MNDKNNKRRNPHEEEFLQKEQEAETSKYADELSQKSYYEAARLEFNVSGVASYAANFVSILTAVSFVLFSFFDLMPDFMPDLLKYALSGGVSIGLLSMLEVVKRANTTSFFRNRYTIRTVPVRSRIALLAFSIFSVIISVLGASDLAKLAADKSDILKDSRAESVAQIQEVADNKVQELEVKIKKVEARMEQQIDDEKFFTYTEAVTKNIAGKRAEQKQIREDAAAKIKEVELSFSADSATNKDKSSKALYFMLGLSIIAEILAIFCLRFRVYYKYKVASQSGYTFGKTDSKKDKRNTSVSDSNAKETFHTDKTRTKSASKVKRETQKPVYESAQHAAEIIIETENEARMGVQKNGWKKQKRCKHCRDFFEPRTRHNKYCTVVCKNAYHNSNRK